MNSSWNQYIPWQMSIAFEGTQYSLWRNSITFGFSGHSDIGVWQCPPPPNVGQGSNLRKLPSSSLCTAAHLWWAMYQLVHPIVLQRSSSLTGSAVHFWWEMYHFSELVKMSPRSTVLWSKLPKTSLNIPADSQPICTKLSEQGSFFRAVEMSPRSAMLWTKLNYISKDHFTGNGNFSLAAGVFLDIRSIVRCLVGTGHQNCRFKRYVVHISYLFNSIQFS